MASSSSSEADLSNIADIQELMLSDEFESIPVEKEELFANDSHREFAGHLEVKRSAVSK